MPAHNVTAVYDRVQETTATVGTGTVSLAGAATGFAGFSDVFSNAETTYYTIVSGNDAWETGVGTFTSSGDTLSRDTVLANSAGTTAKITLTGTSTVFCTYPAGESLHGIGSGGKMVQTSSQTLTTGALNQLIFDSTAAPGFAAVGSAVVLDTTNNKITLTKAGLYQITGMVSTVDDDAMGGSVIWPTLGTSTALAGQFTVDVSAVSYDETYSIITALYYCSSPNDDIFFCVWPDAGGGSSSYSTIVSTDRYKPKFSAVYIR